MQLLIIQTDLWHFTEQGALAALVFLYWSSLFFLCFQINIDQKTRERIQHNIETPSAVCFDDAQKIVYGLMERDSYPRFLKSDIYRTLMDSTSQSVNM